MSVTRARQLRRTMTEADGGQHGERDHARDAVLAAHGWRVLRFWNNDIHGNMPGVLDTILATLNNPLPHAGEGGGAAAG